jgi:uncharacterized protein with GYD domain
METYFMFGKYATGSLQKMSADRTQQAIEEIRTLGGEVNAMHALLGPYDLIICVSLPGIDAAMKASVALARLTGITFQTCPAVTVEMFDRLVT